MVRKLVAVGYRCRSRCIIPPLREVMLLRRARSVRHSHHTLGLTSKTALDLIQKNAVLI